MSFTAPTFDGWIPAQDIWTYASATTFTIVGDRTAIFSVGDKIKLTQTTTKYFYVLGFSFSAGTTTIVINGGSDYTLANASIDTASYSKMTTPKGFPTWFNYTPSFVGWASAPTGFISRFFLVGNAVTVILRDPVGTFTSNSTSTTITGPFNASATVTNGWWAGLGYGFDPGIANTTTIYGNILANSNVIIISAAGRPSVTWGSSGTKIVGSLTIIYEI